MNRNYKEIYDESLKNPEEFWQKVSEDVFWFKKPTKILKKDNPPFYKWFEDGVTNTCYNACLLYTSPSPRDAQLSRMPSSA